MKWLQILMPRKHGMAGAMPSVAYDPNFGEKPKVYVLLGALRVLE